MATETERIKKQLKYHWDGPMWHGSNLQETFKGITAQQVYVKPPGFSHNIYEYTAHMLCWRRFVIEHLNGNTAYSVELNSPADWPVNYETTEAAWQQLLQQFADSQTELTEALNRLTDEMLDEMVPGKKFKWYVLVHGLLHHDIYHSAQINLLKKLTAN